MEKNLYILRGVPGSGKSTLIKTINALEPFQQGEITVNGIAVHDPKAEFLIAGIAVIIAQKGNAFAIG